MDPRYWSARTRNNGDLNQSRLLAHVLDRHASQVLVDLFDTADITALGEP